MALLDPAGTPGQGRSLLCDLQGIPNPCSQPCSAQAQTQHPEKIPFWDFSPSQRFGSEFPWSGSNPMEQRKNGKPPGWPYHGKANVCFLQGWAIVGPVPCHSHHLPLVTHGAVDDSCHGNKELNSKGRIPAWIKLEELQGGGPGEGSAHLSPGCACPWGRSVPAPAAWARSCPAAPAPPAGPEKREVIPLGNFLSHQRANPSWDRTVASPQTLLSTPAASLSKEKRKNQQDLGNPAGFGKPSRAWKIQQDLGNPLGFGKPTGIWKIQQDPENPSGF